MKWSDEAYAPIKQVFLLLLGLILLYMYIEKIFKNEDYNNLCLAYSIFILAWLGTISFRYVFLHYYPMKKVEGCIFEMPYGAKCLFGEMDCEKADFTLFSVIHIVSYIIIGYFIPDQYLIILIVSILCEFLEYFMGFQSKFILDPIINIAGYFIGSTLRNQLT
jgi:hypothetical protein